MHIVKSKWEIDKSAASLQHSNTVATKGPSLLRLVLNWRNSAAGGAVLRLRRASENLREPGLCGLAFVGAIFGLGLREGLSLREAHLGNPDIEAFAGFIGLLFLESLGFLLLGLGALFPHSGYLVLDDLQAVGATALEAVMGRNTIISWACGLCVASEENQGSHNEDKSGTEKNFGQCKKLLTCVLYVPALLADEVCNTDVLDHAAVELVNRIGGPGRGRHNDAMPLERARRGSYISDFTDLLGCANVKLVRRMHAVAKARKNAAHE